MHAQRNLATAFVLVAVGAAGAGGARNVAHAETVVNPAPTARAECTFRPEHFRSAELVFHELSLRSERLAPSAVAASSTADADDAAAPRRRVARAPSPQPPTFTARNFVDSEIFAPMLRDGIRWTSQSTDEEFLRRVTLDLTGAIPDADTIKAFVADRSDGKRDAMIDRLLSSDAFNDRWTMWLGDHLQNVQTASNVNLVWAARNSYYRYLHDSLASHKPYDQLVRELVTAAGLSTSNGAVVYWARQLQNNGAPQDVFDNLATFSGSRFLGLPLMCVSCHNGVGHLEQVNSALAKRTRLDFWREAAFFARSYIAGFPSDPATGKVSYSVRDQPVWEYKLNGASGNKSPRFPVNGSDVVTPAFFLTGEVPPPAEPRRQAYARMLTSNPQFARATVNYIWKELFGAGIVEPADSFDLARQDPASLPAGATLQPTHPKLLARLADEFIASGYDLRALIRTIVISNAYQLSSHYTPGGWDEAWTPYYARHYPRRLMAEEILDAVVKATGVPARIGESDGTFVPRAMLLPDPTEGGSFAQFLNRFQRGNRDDEARNSESSIEQGLALLNDPAVTDRVSAANSASLVARLLQASGTTPDRGQIVDSLYLNTLSRSPTPSERAQGAAYLAAGDLKTRTEDLQFALINKLEFLFN
jgi:hypothetical protein